MLRVRIPCQAPCRLMVLAISDPLTALLIRFANEQIRSGWQGIGVEPKVV
jgi:hypothetical protein